MPEIEPREHDATALTLVMRLRDGKHSSDVFKCGYVFVTRNAKFVRTSRQYCLDSGLINSIQQGPLIHQRELATITWLRTGLGEEDDKIPLSNLLANCDRVLQLRAEVPEAVATMLKEVTPDKIEQFELLLQDHKSMRKLADETLNDENVVTAENAEHLLEVMRLATADEERAKFQREMNDATSQHREKQRKSQELVRLTEAARADATAKLDKLQAQHSAIISGLVQSINSQLTILTRCLSAVMTVIILLAVVQYFTDWLKNAPFWQAILDIGALLGAYHLMMAVLGKPMLNLTTLLNLAAPSLLQKKLDQLNLDHVSINDFRFSNGLVSYNPRDADIE